MVVRPPRQRPPGEFFPGPSFDGPGGLQTGLQTLEDGTGHLLVEGPVQFAYGRTSFTGWVGPTSYHAECTSELNLCFGDPYMTSAQLNFSWESTLLQKFGVFAQASFGGFRFEEWCSLAHASASRP